MKRDRWGKLYQHNDSKGEAMTSESAALTRFLLAALLVIAALDFAVVARAAL